MRKTLALAFIVMLFVACDSENYDTGDGRYSYMTSDFAEIYAKEKGVVDRAVTDDKTTLTLAPNIAVKWVEKTDTAYRALLYYDYRKGETSVRPRSVTQVSVLRPVRTTRPDTLRTDPLKLESVWMSRSGKYLNMRLGVKMGAKDDGTIGKQTIGVKCDTIKGGERTTLVFTLLHNQNGVPQYYTSTAFASIPLDDMARNSNLTLQVNTYDGMKTSNY